MATLDPLPRSLAELLEQTPAPGNRNLWFFTVARNARHYASPEKIRLVLEAVATRWGDRDFRPEIARAVERAFETGGPVLPRPTKPALPWPPFNQDAWDRRKAGPILFGSTPVDVTSEEVIDRLYPTDALLCLALDTRSAQTQPREKWRGLESNMQFIVANAMTAPTGINQSGKPSPRCHDNATRSRRYQVIEFDRGTLREQAAILSSLHSKQRPLILVVWSGGKSLHGWFLVEGLSEYGKLRFFRHAVFLGADPTLWDPAKLVRLPGGRRDTGVRQDILHFNIEPISHA